MKNGFTLAETLITLGIIGVVAAITIPTLISNYKKRIVENQLKTAYSLITQSIITSETVNGSFENWDYSANTDFDKYIFSHLKIAKNCGKRGKGCFKAIPEVNNIDGWYSLDGTYHRGNSEVPSNFSKVILSNGMSLAVMTSGNHIYRFVIDINGPQKGESIMGKDIFKFTLADGVTNAEASNWSTDKGLRPGTECANGSTHKRATIDKLLNDPSCRGGCNKMATSANSRSIGEACSAVIMKNGWKIPDNYPIKF